MTTPTGPELEPLITVANVTRRLGDRATLTDEERTRVEDYIDSVTAVLLDEGLASWTPQTAPPRVRVIAIDAVERRLDNPEQLRQRIMAGDLEMYGGADGWLTVDEVNTVRRLAGKTGTADGTTVLTSSRMGLAAERVAIMRTIGDGPLEGLTYATFDL